MNNTFCKGDKVMTPKGSGIINYIRMKAPEYSVVGVYSVLLDDKVEECKNPPFPAYNGTIFRAEDVQKG